MEVQAVNFIQVFSLLAVFEPLAGKLVFQSFPSRSEVVARSGPLAGSGVGVELDVVGIVYGRFVRYRYR
jgi:hypothetical protein